MIRIDYPPHKFRTKEEDGRKFIFDELRKQWLQMSSEEWVRQNFLQYLLQVQKYPASLIAVERTIQLGELKKRFDILVFDRQHQPWMMIECKAMEVNLSEAVLQQVLRYNIAVPVPYLVITNGTYCIAFQKMGHELKMIESLPAFIN